MAEYSVTVGFDHSHPAGSVRLQGKLPENLHDYVLSPAYGKKSDGKLHVIEYALIHRSLLPPADVWEERNKQALAGPPMLDPEDL